ncbi:hypothetical protein ACIQXV_11190 [Neobacillus sp. NPDC097160]|uniref:hypothetical protein n=1 Tax=Neobacillus sp. NPDC097160 TaxID=3364298 RepID=UPI0038037ECE
MDDTLLSRHTIGGQKEKQKEKQKQLQQQQQKDFSSKRENHLDIENPLLKVSKIIF